ncbi:MAG: glutamate--tRNA ligase family protein [Ignavibacteriales bacterium]|nr:glutamate--tRNA ligase family protein [Ignavibacteriales bacterium]
MVRGWDDPRLTTLRGLRRRGVTPEAIINFVTGTGETKNDSWVEMAQLEAVIRDDLNKRALRRMAVLKPLKLVIDNYPEGQTEEMEAVNNPEDPTAGTRKVPFSKVLYIEQDDFRETPPPKYYPPVPGQRGPPALCLSGQMHAAWSKTMTGEVVEVHCTYDPATRGGDAPDGRKVKSTIHWVSAEHAIPAEVRLYEQLFTVERPDDGEIWKASSIPIRWKCWRHAFVEPALAEAKAGRQNPVRTHRLFLPRSRLAPRQACLQPHSNAQRQLGEDRKEKPLGSHDDRTCQKIPGIAAQFLASRGSRGAKTHRNGTLAGVRHGASCFRPGHVRVLDAHAQVRDRPLPFDGQAHAKDHRTDRQIVWREHDQT